MDRLVFVGDLRVDTSYIVCGEIGVCSGRGSPEIASTRRARQEIGAGEARGRERSWKRGDQGYNSGESVYVCLLNST